jgi:hypothetical protein
MSDETRIFPPEKVMKLIRRTCAVGLAMGALFAAGGCWNTGQQSAPIVVPVEPNPPPTIETRTTQRVKDVGAKVDQFNRYVQQLPGASEPIHRVMMEQAFGDLVGILPVLEGPDADAIFRQQIRLIDSTRDQLTALPTNLSSEPLIGTGLRAAYNALQDMVTQQFSDQTDMPGQLDTLSDKLDALDTAHDSANRQLVADAARLIGGIMRQMDNALMQRLEQAASQPSTEPSTQPAAQP